MRPWRSLVSWWRWEMGREIELDGVIRLIILERFVKAIVLVVAGTALVVAGAATDLPSRLEDLQAQLALDPGHHLIRRLLSSALDHLGRHPNAIGVAAILYGLLEGLEGAGLVRRRRWAEYLVVVATSAFLPLEVSELTTNPSLGKAGALVVNLAIVVYLVWRKRLFRPRPSAAATAARA